MKAIETTINVRSDRTGVVQLPDDVSPGEHAVIVVIDAAPKSPIQQRQPLDLPTHDVGPWPANVSLRREDMYGDDGR
jgi:hypothetical protein